MQPVERNKYWSPYVAGACAGLVLVFSVLFAGKYFGASTTFVRSVGLIEKSFNAERVDRMAYFISKTPKIDWQWMFVVGVLLGSLIASRMSGTFKSQGVPDMWRERFGAKAVPRAVVAFVGGTVTMVGARLAGGCPSGHGLSGLAQLAVSGFIALACFFVGGMLVANIMYRVGNK